MNNAQKPAIAVDLTQVDILNGLGVPRYLFSLLAALSGDFRIHLKTSSGAPKLYTSFGGDPESLVIHGEESSWSGVNANVEILAHHFARPSLGLPYVLWLHDLHVYDIPWKYGSPGRTTAAMERKLMLADAVVTPFPRVAKDLFKKTGLHHNRLHVIPHVDLPLNVSTCTPVLKFTNTLLYPAQFQPHKNHLALLSLHCTLVRLGYGVRTICIGSDSSNSSLQQIKSIVSNSRFSAGFEVLGRVDDEKLEDLMAKVSAVIVPSIAEGGAQVAWEATLRNRPVILNSISAASADASAKRFSPIWIDVGNLADSVSTVARFLDGQLPHDPDKVSPISASAKDSWKRLLNRLSSDGREKDVGV